MSLRTLSILIPLLLAPWPALGCSCLWQGNFAAIDKNGLTIVRGKVLSHKGNSMDLAVDEVLQGKLYREEIRIWGETGNLCRADLSRFEDGSEWLFALNAIDSVPEDGFNPSTPNISYGRVGDFSLNRCGVYWLKHHEGHVSGNVDDDKRWLYRDRKKSPVSLELIRAYLEGSVERDVLAKAAEPREESRELMLDTRVFLEQQRREQLLREQLE